MAMPNTVSF